MLVCDQVDLVRFAVVPLVVGNLELKNLVRELANHILLHTSGTVGQLHELISNVRTLNVIGLVVWCTLHHEPHHLIVKRTVLTKFLEVFRIVQRESHDSISELQYKHHVNLAGTICEVQRGSFYNFIET